MCVAGLANAQSLGGKKSTNALPLGLKRWTNALPLPWGRGGGGWAWAHLELTDALISRLDYRAYNWETEGL